MNNHKEEKKPSIHRKIESLQRTILWMCNQIQDAIDRLPDEAGYSDGVKNGSSGYIDR
jgi:hypothetical protein